MQFNPNIRRLVSLTVIVMMAFPAVCRAEGFASY